MVCKIPGLQHTKNRRKGLGINRRARLKPQKRSTNKQKILPLVPP